MLVYLSLRLTQEQRGLLSDVIEVNQSLLNQVRAKDVSALQGLNMVTGTDTVSDPYLSTEEREMSAWMDSVSHQHEVGEPQFDELTEEELASMRSEL